MNLPEQLDPLWDRFSDDGQQPGKSPGASDEEAILAEVLRRIGDEARDELEACARRGDVLSEWGLVERALFDYKRAAVLEKSSRWRRKIADSYFVMGLPQQAFRAYKTALSLDPADPESHFYLGEFLRAMGRTRWAIEEFLEAARLAPTRAYYFLRLGEACLAVGQLPESVRWLRQAVSIDGTDPYYRFRLANAFMRWGRIEPAIEQLQEAVAFAPCDDYYHALLAMAYWGTGRVSQSVSLLERAVEIRPKNSAYRFLLAEVYERAGLNTLARQQKQKAGRLGDYDRDYVHRLRNKVFADEEWQRPEWT